MQNNFLEELVAEWLEYNGYFVKRNERVGQFVKGGQGELDVVAFNPQKNHLIHVEAETSTFVDKPRKDMHSRNDSEKKFKRKFETGEKYIRDLFKGLTVPDVIEKEALFAYGSNKKGGTIGGGQVVLAKNYILNILRELKKPSSLLRIVPEKYPILRVLQMVAYYWGYFDKGLK
jgi:hypothetical protein